MSVELKPTNSNQPIDQARTEVEALVVDFPYRTPIIEDYYPEIHDKRQGEDFSQTMERAKAFDDKNRAYDHKVDNQWKLITESFRRGILANPDMRGVIKRYNSVPLGEGLVNNAVQEVSAVDERTARLSRFMSKTLGKVLELESVPDVLITPDIRHAPLLIRKEAQVDSLVRWGKRDSEFFDEIFEDKKRQVTENPGITNKEKELIARRYRYARDLKLLGLSAELYDEPVGRPEVHDGLISHELSSGTRLVMSAEAFQATPTILDPSKWEGRTQLKDRVYVVTIDGKEFIMKERKTARHMDVKKHGHKDGLTSEQEFNVASEFAKLGTIKQDDVELHWEKPLGYVEFPDGYQFCVFGSEANLRADPPDYQLREAILESKEDYLEEFAQISLRAREIFENRKDLLRGYEIRDARNKPKKIAFSKSSRSYKKYIKDQPKSDELTFDEFAQLKSNYISDEAKELLSQTMLDRGYTNSDMDGYAFRLKGDRHPKLEIIGFDFEYYFKDPKMVDHITKSRRQANDKGDIARMLAFYFEDTRAIGLAASYAMIEQMGFKLPPIIEK